MTEALANEFAAEWIAAWNAHDIDRILSHYADDVRFTSPFVQRIAGQADGVLQGIPALRTYFDAALAKYPDLHFKLELVLAGVNSATLKYRSVNNLHAAEVMVLNADGQISSVLAHYASEATHDRSNPQNPKQSS